MKNIRFIFLAITALAMANCGGGAVGALIKMRDTGKSLAIACNYILSEAGPMGYNGSEPEILREAYLPEKWVDHEYVGDWSIEEGNLAAAWSNENCQKIYKFVKESLKYANVDLVELKKIPTTKVKSIFGEHDLPDFSQTQYDYVWLLNFDFSRYAHMNLDYNVIDTQRKRYDKYRYQVIRKYTSFYNIIRSGYTVEDWTKKDINFRGIKAMGDYAQCSTFERQDDTHEPDKVEFVPLSLADLTDCNKRASKTMEKFQKTFDELNSKKKS